MDNVTLDFTITTNYTVENQEKAVMSATLAKRLLKLFAEKLSNTTFNRVIELQVAALRDCKTIEQALQTSMDFVQERELIANIEAENWDAYSTELVVSNGKKSIHEDIYG